MKPDPERLRPLLDLEAPTDTVSQQRVVGMFAYYSRWIRDFSLKIRPIVQNTVFPLTDEVLNAFNGLKNNLKDACVTAVDPTQTLVVETDASDYAIGATLSQNRRPVAFFSRTLKNHELKLHSEEKEAYAIVEALRDWKHYLLGNRFKLMTDQKSVAFMFDNKPKGKIKNDKIARWRMELSNNKFDITYRPGNYNPSADVFSRVYCAPSQPLQQLDQLHASLCHPGITRLLHFVQTRNLPYSINDIKTVVNQCKVP